MRCCVMSPDRLAPWFGPHHQINDGGDGDILGTLVRLRDGYSNGEHLSIYPASLNRAMTLALLDV